MVKSVILAAGKGTRMKSDIPKVLHEIFNKALLSYVIDSLEGISEENYVIAGHLAEKVEEYVKKSPTNTKIAIQTPQLGTGHALSTVCPYLNDYEDDVIVLCGDTPLITSDTLKVFLETHKQNRSDITVMSAVFENPSNYGRIVRNSDGKISSIIEEKDATPTQKAIKEVNAGIYCFKWDKIKNVFSELKTDNAQGEYYLTDIVKWGNEHGLSVNSYVLEDNEEIFGINSRSDLAKAAQILNKRTLNKLMESGVTVIDPSTTWVDPRTKIEKDTVIYPFCYIEGENIIGSNCKIGPFARLRGDAVIEDNVKIGNFVEVKKSHIKSHTNACHLSYIGDSDIGENVNIGAGTITANYDPISGVKSKTVLKNNVKIGSNSVLVAPVEIKEGANIGALSVITKDISEWSLALTRAPLKIFEAWVKKRIKK